MFQTRLTSPLSAMLIACCPLVTWGQDSEPAPAGTQAVYQPEPAKADYQQVPQTVYQPASATAYQRGQTVPIETMYQSVAQGIPLMKGYFLSEEQLKKLSPAARAEFEKLLKAREDQATRLKIYEQRVKEEYQTAQEALKRALAEREALDKQDQFVYRYMIGVAVEPNESKEEGGVIVSKVVEDSPAEQAGVAPGEVILSVKGERRISSPQDLIEAVEASEGKELVLHLKTYGKEVTERFLKIIPVKRPDKYQTGETPTDTDQIEDEVQKKWQAAQKQYQQNNLKFRSIHPGIYWDPTALRHDLPENVTISVSKSGKNPAKIVVTRDGESWDMDETEVDQLPEDLRAPVKRLLTRPGISLWSTIRNAQLAPATPAGVSPQQIQWKKVETDQRKEVQTLRDRQVQQLQQQLDELQKAVEKLQQGQQQE